MSSNYEQDTNVLNFNRAKEVEPLVDPDDIIGEIMASYALFDEDVELDELDEDFDESMQLSDSQLQDLLLGAKTQEMALSSAHEMMDSIVDRMNRLHYYLNELEGQVLE